MTFLFALYWIAIGALFIYGINCYFLLFTFWRNKNSKIREIAQQAPLTSFPKVTVQLPIFNERYVVRRLIQAVSAFDYPASQLEIQVLDDSTDDTSEIIQDVLNEMGETPYRIVHIQRKKRIGFKAGALEEGLKQASGELIAIFDADFCPEPNFLKQTLPFFTDTKLAFVQARWDHLNRDHSILTKCQALAIDGHFAIEQGAREWGGYFLNFNGTAGVWRRNAIIDSGGWEHDTLTEDLDLSYRAQLRGWKVKYLPNVSVSAELPTSLSAFKSQQRRWAKGSIETALKLLPSVWRSPISMGKKVQATLHLTHYLIHPLMFLLSLLSFPVLVLWTGPWSPIGTLAALGLIMVGTLSTSSLYVGSQLFLYRDWYRRVLYIPGLMCLGTGIAISNSIAVWEALRKIPTDFVRTPKWNLDSREVIRWNRLRYRLKIGPVIAAEILLSIYCIFTLVQVSSSQSFFISPFLIIYAMGFSFVSLMTMSEAIEVYWSRTES